MAARYPHCAVLMWLHGVVRRRYVAAMVRREEESGRVLLMKLTITCFNGSQLVKMKKSTFPGRTRAFPTRDPHTACGPQGNIVQPARSYTFHSISGINEIMKPEIVRYYNLRLN